MLLASAGKTPNRRWVLQCRCLFGWPWGESKEKRAERRKQLELEVDYVSELREYRQNRGKRFDAESSLLLKEEALKFPSVVGSSLSGDVLSLPLARTSLVLVSMRATGMKTCDQYRKVLEENFYGRVPVLDLSLLENRTFVWLQAWITKNLRKTIPSSRHSSFMVYSGKVVPELRKTLEVHNSFLGYAYLLDKEGLVRWKAHALPTQKELQTMTACTKQLLIE